MSEDLRSPAGEEMALQNNMFVENILPAWILQDLSEEKMNEYRHPLTNAGEDRRPTLRWSRQTSIGGEPADVAEIDGAYSQCQTQSPVPKLFIEFDRGILINGLVSDFVRSFPNLTETKVLGLHFMQEDSTHELARPSATGTRKCKIHGMTQTQALPADLQPSRRAVFHQ